MIFEWDEEKNRLNLYKHGIAFEAVYVLNWDKMVFLDRSRHSDGEPRYGAIGHYKGKLYTVIFTKRQERLRPISLRRANKAEERVYESIKA